MSVIFKNLWNRRRQNVWLFIELILVSILAWIMVDPVAVSIADTSLPLGYDADRLVYVSMKAIPSDAPGYDGAADSADRKRACVDAIMAKVRQYPGVEHATHTFSYSIIGSGSLSTNNFAICDPAVDTIVKSHCFLVYVPGQEFFETYGFKAAPGSPSVSEISDMYSADDDCLVISRELGEDYWPGENAIGKRAILNGWKLKNGSADTVWATVRGVVEGARWHSFNRSYTLQFRGRYGKDGVPDELDELNVVLRLRDGVDMNEFLAEFRPWADNALRIDNLYMFSASPYRSVIYETEEMFGIHSERNSKMLLAAFFLLNLVLGTIGCFWLQTRKRVKEIGVRRAYGARRVNIIVMLLGESAMLATVSVLAGVLIYLQFALKYHSLDAGFSNNCKFSLHDTWVNHFGEHFLIISAIVYAIILLCVLIGTLIPAVSASRVDITDALRDE